MDDTGKRTMKGRCVPLSLALDLDVATVQLTMCLEIARPRPSPP